MIGNRVNIKNIRDHPQYNWLKNMLDARGLDILEDREWETHDSHDSELPVFIGPVLLNKKIEILIGVHSNYVYQIDNYSKWWIKNPENIIPVKIIN